MIPAFPAGSDGKESAYTVGDLGLIHRLGRSPGEGHSNLVQYSCLDNPMDGQLLLNDCFIRLCFGILGTKNINCFPLPEPQNLWCFLPRHCYCSSHFMAVK